MISIDVDSFVVASRNQVASDLAGETVLLSMTTAHYYGLADVGARIWELLREPIRVSAICSVVTSEYDVTPERCEEDVILFLKDLASNGLIEVSSGP
jgi:hypothetical protein